MEKEPVNTVESKDEAWGQCYIGTKIIRAEPMDYETWARSQNKWTENQETLGEGYCVKYDDGYISWSPKQTFENAYRKLTLNEKRSVY